MTIVRTCVQKLEPEKPKKIRNAKRGKGGGRGVREEQDSDWTGVPKLEPKKPKKSKNGFRGKGIMKAREGCHACSQTRVVGYVCCSRCPIKFCGRCLKNRHGEKVLVEMRRNVRWVCPKCRGGCGPGCKTCCICASCRRAEGLETAGQLKPVADLHGYDNVHDYLVFLETGEDRYVIMRRKEKRRWTAATGARDDSISLTDQHEDDIIHHWDAATKSENENHGLDGVLVCTKNSSNKSPCSLATPAVVVEGVETNYNDTESVGSSQMDSLIPSDSLPNATRETNVKDSTSQLSNSTNYAGGNNGDQKQSTGNGGM